MPEYVDVERPFLDKLRQIGWEVILTEEFRASLKRINLTEDGHSWLTEKQIDDIFGK